MTITIDELIYRESLCFNCKEKKKNCSYEIVVGNRWNPEIEDVEERVGIELLCPECSLEKYVHPLDISYYDVSEIDEENGLLDYLDCRFELSGAKN